MSVESRLGLDADMGYFIAECWPGWVAQLPQLAAAEDPRQLRVWMEDADPERVDDVLHALVWLGSVEGGDDVAAATVICWVLVPGTAFIARQLRGLSPDIDHLVASRGLAGLAHTSSPRRSPSTPPPSANPP